MPAVRYSRYQYATVHQDPDGNYYLDVPDPLPKRRYADDTRPVVKEGDDAFSLAWRAYESARDPEQDVRPTGFFWVIALANDHLDAAAPLAPGSRPRVHSVETLFSEILVPPPYFSQGDQEVSSP